MIQKHGSPEGFTSRLSLLPKSSSSKNFASCVVVDFAAARKSGPRCVTRDRHDPQERALEWLRQLETGEVASRAAIARREGLSRARVTQALNRSGATIRRSPVANAQDEPGLWSVALPAPPASDGKHDTC